MQTGTAFVHVPQENTRDSRIAMGVTPPRPAASERIASWLREEILVAPLVPVLHPSPLRMKGLGLFTLLGHPLFWFVWAVWIPQPYENLPLRLLTASLGLLLVSDRVSSDPTSRLSGQVFTAVFWFELPFLFSWMYLCNSGNPAWIASMAAMILTYYFATDWRIATVGIALGGIAARILFGLVGPEVPPMAHDVALTNTMVLAFCISMGMLLGVSSANLRREHLAQTLTTMGIMAHELRTPLATMSLIGDAVRGAAGDCDPDTAQKLEQLSGRLHTLVRNMNHQIDIQISNARLMRLPSRKEAVSAGNLVHEAIANYPFRSTREREAVQVVVRQDFVFEGSQALFGQVVDNLVKNALRSLAATGAALSLGDLLVEVDRRGGRGTIVIADRGIGIEHELQGRIFEPFFSTNRGTGHGLGLAFAQRVVHAARGTIRVKSESRRGAVFTIDLPILR
jgi:two-component system CAI-1 autoinducer sensor kinase/phosphatase CqsS